MAKKARQKKDGGRHIPLPEFDMRVLALVRDVRFHQEIHSKFKNGLTHSQWLLFARWHFDDEYRDGDPNLLIANYMVILTADGKFLARRSWDMTPTYQIRHCKTRIPILLVVAEAIANESYRIAKQILDREIEKLSV